MKKFCLFLAVFASMMMLSFNTSLARQAEAGETTAQVGMIIESTASTVNVCNAPSGKVVKRLRTSGYLYVFNATEVRDGWLKVNKRSFIRYHDDSDENANYKLLSRVSGQCWIKSSDARTYVEKLGALPVEYTLYEGPSTSERVLYVDNQQHGDDFDDDALIVLEIRDGWTKVKTPSGLIGWTDATLNVELFSA